MTLLNFLAKLGVCKAGGEMRRLISYQKLYVDNYLADPNLLVNISIPHVVELRTNKPRIWHYTPGDQ